MTPDEREQLAADYVLGALGASEREAARALIGRDPAFAAAVTAWEERLAPMADAVEPVEPPADLLPRIVAAIETAPGIGTVAPEVRPEAAGSPEGGLGGPRPVTLEPKVVMASPHEVPPGAPRVDPAARLADAAGPADVIDLTRSLQRWRAFAATAAAVAAGLAAVVVIDRLPEPQVNETGRYLAVVNADGAMPALVIDVDTARGLVTVRSLAARRPAEGDLELWAIPEGGTPVSLGVVDPADPVQRIRPDRAGVIPTRGSFAVSVEPAGGSPTGAPTGPVVYSGVLVPAAE